MDYERFAALQDTRPVEEVRTVCFFGHVSRERTDFAALRAIAGAGFVVRLVGGLGHVERGFLGTPGVDYRGEVSHARSRPRSRGVDAFVLPYRINGLTRGISPAKTYECLATGKPVVAAPLPAMEELAGHVYLARRPEDYVKALRKLRQTETEERVRARIELARENSWDARFAGAGRGPVARSCRTLRGQGGGARGRRGPGDGGRVARGDGATDPARGAGPGAERQRPLPEPVLRGPGGCGVS